MTEENKILVIYVGVGNIRSADIEEFTQRVTRRITPSTFKGEIIIIPTTSPDTRVECINPKYITDEELIREHTELMKKLKEELQNQLEQLNEEKNG
jgi:hypothetical protein